MNRQLLTVVLLLHLLAVPTRTQQPDAAKTPKQNQDEVVRITTNLVQIDAAVTDKKGRPVTDLQKEDFEIYEDGKPQPITNFSFVSVGSAISPAGGVEKTAAARDKSVAAVPLPTIKLRPEQVQRTVALVVDDLGLSFESMHFVRDALRKFVDQQMQPGDLVAIIRTGAGVGALQQFTSDKRLLYAAIDRVKWNSRGRAGIAAFAPIEDSPLNTFNNSTSLQGGGAAGPVNPHMKDDQEKALRQTYGDFRDEVFSVGTLGALNYIVRGLRTLPGRKSVVLLSDTLTLFDSEGNGQYRTIQALRRLTDLANRASVVVYTIDPRGLQPLNLTAADNTSAVATLGDGILTRGNSGAAAMEALNQKTLDVWHDQEGLKYLAFETGGFFVSNNNDVGQGIKRALDDSKDYYLIGYRPDESTFDTHTGRRRYHQVSVQVKRPGLVVRTRTGFFGIPNEEAKPTGRTVGEQLMAAITTPFESAAVDLRLTSIFMNEAPYGSFMRSFIFVKGNSLTFREQPDGSYHAAVDVLAMTFDDAGVPVDQRSRSQEIVVPRAQYQSALDHGLIFGINLPVQTPGAFQLRIAVRDGASGRVGSANQYIEVPDLKKDRLTLSGLYLAERDLGQSNLARVNTSGAPVTSEGQIDERNPESGPAVRRFRNNGVIEYGFEVYNAKIDKTSHQTRLTSQVRLFHDNQLVFTGKVLALQGQADINHLVAFGQLPLNGSLPAGDYVLQVIVIDALAKEKKRLATQWLDFEIK